jgi:sugar phosphate isomerase/epimerase
MNSKIIFAVFVKPWKKLPLPELAKHIRRSGFSWIELPVRPGFPCEPEAIETALPDAVSLLADEGIRVLNVTAALPLDDERLYAACLKAGITMNRVMFDRQEGENYWEAEMRARRALDAAIPFCEKYGFQIGVQNHSGRNVPVNAMGQYHLLKDYDPRYVGAIWDPAHNALEGEDPEPALDMVASHLCVVNLKNAFWKRVNGPEAQAAAWSIYWTTGRNGRASWPRVAAKLKQINYQGPLCLSAEYSAETEVDRLIVEDLAYAKACFLNKTL